MFDVTETNVVVDGWVSGWVGQWYNSQGWWSDILCTAPLFTPTHPPPLCPSGSVRGAVRKRTGPNEATRIHAHPTQRQLEPIRQRQRHLHHSRLQPEGNRRRAQRANHRLHLPRNTTTTIIQNRQFQPESTLGVSQNRRPPRTPRSVASAQGKCARAT
jgi:hypothetical protein